MIVELAIFAYRANFHDKFYDALPYITNDPDKHPHSLYTMHRFEAPYSSWLHQRGQAYSDEFEVKRSILRTVNQGPLFAKRLTEPLILPHPDYTTYYTETMGSLTDL